MRDIILNLSEQTKQRITKAWVWGLITDEEYKTLMEVELSDTQSMEAS